MRSGGRATRRRPATESHVDALAAARRLTSGRQGRASPRVGAAPRRDAPSANASTQIRMPRPLRPRAASRRIRHGSGRHLQTLVARVDGLQSSHRLAAPFNTAPSYTSSQPLRTSPSTRAPGASVSLPRVVITAPPPLSPTVPQT